ncbi:hypothetical protein PROFUN_01706 [Planoprotostelium fungivorum]|uniref:Uncharacterized protein n=1 Tax=Planoprotostelium fungivorum TaxID=1890364 RepID=A0A2P6MW98_9EUKA|nr:hypothetical protein PROFUN_01706 [Planoprotostelium fungivorum]
MFARTYQLAVSSWRHSGNQQVLYGTIRAFYLGLTLWLIARAVKEVALSACSVWHLTGLHCTYHNDHHFFIFNIFCTSTASSTSSTSSTTSGTSISISSASSAEATSPMKIINTVYKQYNYHHWTSSERDLQDNYNFPIDNQIYFTVPNVSASQPSMADRSREKVNTNQTEEVPIRLSLSMTLDLKRTVFGLFWLLLKPFLQKEKLVSA